MDIRREFEDKNIHDFIAAKHKIRASKLSVLVGIAYRFTIVMFYNYVDSIRIRYLKCWENFVVVRISNNFLSISTLTTF